MKIRERKAMCGLATYKRNAVVWRSFKIPSG
jgi:hypothetical protein